MIVANIQGNEERRVIVEGQTFVVARAASLGEWHVHWQGDPPDDCHPELGCLAYTRGTDGTTDLVVVNVDQIDYRKKLALLRDVATAAGLRVRPPARCAS